VEGRFRLGGAGHLHYLREISAVNLLKNRTALVVPIHDAYFGYSINLLYQSIGSDYDIVFVFSTDVDRRAFGEVQIQSRVETEKRLPSFEYRLLDAAWYCNYSRPRRH
jgi:hypothetical protein